MFTGRASSSALTAGILLGVARRPGLQLLPGTSCQGFVDMTMPNVDVFVPVVGGAFTLAVGVPNLPELVDMKRGAQGIAFPGTSAFGADFTNGVLLVLGG